MEVEMVRTEVHFTEEKASRLKELAQEGSVAVPELIHEAVVQLLRPHGLLATDERRRRALAASGKFSSDVTDLSRNHDAYLAEAYES
jgi:hypothetical protein